MATEKNRFGEEQFSERAQEDLYFAAKDRELFEEMKAQARKVEATERKERARTCPRCAGRLGSYRFMEFVLDRCESCEGLWLEKGKLEGILRRAARGPVGAFLGRCFSKDEKVRQT